MPSTQPDSDTPDSDTGGSARSPFPLSAWYLHRFVSEFVLIYPTYLIMMEQSGVAPAELGLLLMLWSATLLIFEVPSGVLGDLFPRKRVIMAGGCVQALAFFTWLAMPSFWGFAVGFAIWSIGISLASGTSEAYLFEALGGEAEFEKVYGRTEAVESLGIAAALLCGGFAASNGFTVPLVASLLAPLAGVLIMLIWLPDLPLSTDSGVHPWQDFRRTFRRTFVSGTRTIFNRPVLRFLILAAATLGAIAGVYEEYVGVFLVSHGFTLAEVGLIYAGVWLSRTVGSFFANRLAGRNLLTPLVIFTLSGLLLSITGLLDSLILMLLALFLYFGQSGTLDVVYGAALQRRVEDHHRATITSYMSMSLETIAALYFLLFGFLGAAWGWHAALTVGAGTGVILSLVWCARYIHHRPMLTQRAQQPGTKP